ncbi:TIR domain-containing protein [Planosporangium flavigriseum]|uniref:TIR domain-containing protein n=1 Tax=Planosporangium flavigriseum TaxID=373681 RepID=A0A8J3PLV7_9ACTN|nr:TIR domain-containing protein [Planosporangium flavigriseum]NJC64263.1 TIR domain-containing protein [Planosporangium flavigriseum]GIG74252.1 hypothetical protein Pfl04_26560 [Planosporangium flavigriseum]
MEYEVCLSYAAEDREYVAEVANVLRDRSVDVFYDQYEDAALWGKNMQIHFTGVFASARRYCVVFISANYVKETKFWTKVERESALQRAFMEAGEYLLPARFDDTEVPWILRTIRYVDLRETTPAELADLICRKLMLGPEPTDQDDGSFPRWFEPTRLALGDVTDEVHSYQGAPVDGSADGLDRVFRKTVRRLADLARRDGDARYWTQGEDRRFDRLYATASVATALAQLGLAHDAPPLREAVAFLRSTDPSSIDDRAATIFLLITNKLDADGCLRFVEAIAQHQVQDPESALHGSFLLPQGPAPDRRADGRPLWTTAPVHAGGASFHACHLADVLLHLPPHAAQARRAAEPVLAGIREFLIRSLDRNRGWLVDLQGNPTPQTLYAFALCSALAIPFPANWRTVTEKSFEMLTAGAFGMVTRCFGVMNAWYIYATRKDEAFRADAAQFAQGEAGALARHLDATALGALDIAAVQRALDCTVRLTDHRLSRFVAPAVRAAASKVDWESSDQV